MNELLEKLFSHASELNHTADTLIVSIALVVSALLIRNGLRRIEKKLRPESATELRKRLGLPDKECRHTWDKIPTIADYVDMDKLAEEDEYGA